MMDLRGLSPLGYVALLLLGLLAGCGAGTAPSPDVVAVIEGGQRGYGDFEAYLQANSLGPDAGLGSPVLSRLLDQWIDEELLRHWALAEGLVREGAGRREAVQAILAAQSHVRVSEAEVRAWYEENPGEFRMDARVRMRQMLFADREVAARVREEWSSGIPFEELLGRYSRYLQAFQGDEVELTRDDLPNVFAEAIFALQPGEVGPVHDADYGFHIFQVTQILPPSEISLEEAAGQIRAHLESDRTDARLEEILESARSRFGVEIYWRNIPFNYDGRYRQGALSPAGE